MDKHFESDRFGWIEQIADKKFYQVINSLSYKDKEILTFLIFNGFSQKEIALQLGVKKSALSRKIGRLKNFLKKFLENVNF